MPSYRAYLVGQNGHFTNVEVIEAEDDNQAIERTVQFAEGRDVELWHMDRKIAVPA